MPRLILVLAGQMSSCRFCHTAAEFVSLPTRALVALEPNMMGNFALAPGVIFKPLLDAGVSFSGPSWVEV